MRHFLVFNAVLLALFLTSPVALGEIYHANDTTISSDYNNSRNSRDYDEDDIEEFKESTQDAVEDNTSYRMDENGFLVPTGQQGEMAIPGQEDKEKPGFSQKANNPNKQVYKGGEKKALVAPRTHRMYEDNQY